MWLDQQRQMLAPFHGAATPEQVESLNLGRVLFLVSSFVAPIEILLVGSFTVYDLLTTVLFVLVLSRGRVTLPPPAIFWSALVFVAFALLSTLRAVRPDQSLTQVLQYLFILFVQLPVIIFFVRSRFMIHASLCAFILGTLVGIGDAYLDPQALEAGRIGTSFLANSPNRLGYPTAYLSPFLFYLVFHRWREKRGRLSALLCGGGIGYLLLWALAASGSRGATAGALVGLTVFLAFRRGIAIGPQALARGLAALLVVGACSFLIYRSDYFPETLRTRIDRTLAAESSLVQDRTTLAYAGWQAFSESPFVGVGLDNFRYISDRYLPTVTQQLPHNLWLQLLVHTGILGTLGFLGIFVFWFGSLLRAQRFQPLAGRRELAWAFIASMCAIQTFHMFIPVLIQRPYWWVFGLGLSAVLHWQAADTDRMSNERQREAF